MTDDRNAARERHHRRARARHAIRYDLPVVLIDALVVIAAYLVPLVLRFDGSVPSDYWTNYRIVAPLAALAHLSANHVFALYGQLWRYASVQEARRLVLAAGTGGILVFGFNVLLGGEVLPLPRSVVALGAILSLIGFAAVRFQHRLLAVRRRGEDDGSSRVLLVGGGQAAAILIQDAFRHPEAGLLPVAIVDDDPRKQGREVHGVPVVGDLSRIPEVVSARSIDTVVLAIPSASVELMRRVDDRCREARVTLRVTPTSSELVRLNDRLSIRDLRDLRIEDVLFREEVDVDLAAVGAMLRGRRVLITGAGGSIGAEITRQVLSFDPAAVLALDHDETHLHDLTLSVEGHAAIEPLLADIRDRERIYDLIAQHRPDVIFHAAAHKHVPLLEGQPDEALRTNVLGTANVADAAAASGAERFVLISTDKAIRPASVMGASKWLAEQVVRSVTAGSCAFSVVRFGNVLGSRGSVIPTFLRQIEHGGPVTVTDPSMVRYFMSIREAVRLVLQSATLARGGEVFTLDMGEPVPIMELAQRLIRLAGHRPGDDVHIEIVGSRPGEKLVEDITDPGERRLPSEHPSIAVSRPSAIDPAYLRHTIGELERLASTGGKERLRTRMLELSLAPVATTGGRHP